MKYIKERTRKKRKNKEESLQIRDYIHKYTSSYIYIYNRTYSCTTYTAIY